MSDSLSKLQSLVDVVVAAHASGETDAQFLARLDMQDAAEKERLESTYPICDCGTCQAVWADSEDDQEERSTFYID
jgi:hypothetical protein